VDNNTLLMIFIGVVSVALVLQALALIGIYRAVRILSKRLDEMAAGVVRDLRDLTTKANDALMMIKTVGEGINSLRENVEKTMTIVHNRVESLDAFLGETTDIARLEILRLQDTIDNSARKVDEAFDMLRNSILAPISEINAIARGIRTGIDFLFKKRRGVSRAFHEDGELFI
jgi:hypothetical protein